MSSKGTIKRIVSEKGFGFVADEAGQEYFFHQSACQSFDSLREGQAVTFRPGRAPRVRAPRTSANSSASAPFRGRALWRPHLESPAFSSWPRSVL